MDDGLGALLIVFIIAAIAGGGAMLDKLRGTYPRRWDD